MTSPAPDVVRTVAVRGIAARVSVRPGTGRLVDEPPLLLCNGIGSSLELLQGFVDQLDPRRGVVRFDVPGVGGSALPPFPYTIAGLSSWVTALMASSATISFDVLGISWGGGLAQQLRRPVATPGAPTGPRGDRHGLDDGSWEPRGAADHVDAATSTAIRPYADKVAGTIYGGSMRTSPERGASLLHAATRSGPKRGYYYQLLAMTGWTSVPFLGLIRQPTLVLGGDDDPIIPSANPRMQARLIPHARLHVYEGGHLALLTEADQLAPVIDSFLDETDE